MTNYSGQYDAYVYKVNKEIEAGERELASQHVPPPSPHLKDASKGTHARPNRAAARMAKRDERLVRKELKALERTIAQLDDQKPSLNAELLKSTDAKEALRLHNEVTALSEQLSEAEEKWCALQEEIEGAA